MPQMNKGHHSGLNFILCPSQMGRNPQAWGLFLCSAALRMAGAELSFRGTVSPRGGNL